MKSLFNFYLDDDVKAKAVKKLNDIYGEQSKGMLAAYLRVCVNTLIEEELDYVILSAIQEEFEYSKVKNKRSKL